MQEQDLFQKLARQDEAAFQLLFNRHYQAIFNIAYRFLLNKTEAEDAVQEIFIRAFKSAPKFRGQCKPETWLYRIAVNYCLNCQRSAKRARWISLSFWNEKDSVLPHGDTPVDKMEKQEAEQIIQKAIQSLSERQRTALTLSRYEELSNIEISDIMNCSESAVESLLHQAKKNLAKKIIHLLK